MMTEGSQLPDTVRSATMSEIFRGPFFSTATARSGPLHPGTPSKPPSSSPPRRELTGSCASRGPGLAYAACALFVVLISVMLVEVIVLLALAAGPALTLTSEMGTMVRHMNQGASEVDFNFGVTVNQLGGGGGVSAYAKPAPDVISSGNGTASGGEDPFLVWCEGAACTEGQNCTELSAKMAEGVDAQMGAPIIPFPTTFCEGVKVLNDNLCFCRPALEESGFPGEGQALLDNMGFVAMLCPGFGEENVGESGEC